ncbi:DUF732 domain-containing protein [Mycobacterium sp. NPDC006124]|uniref:DUF732 domain-containing protein n=1 Tax=Mycobacterium sp. NPDC006124 TaxID=3156729 RepID=UPI0033AE3A63
MKVVFAAVVAALTAIGVSAPAAADEAGYLNELAPRLTSLSTQQLRTEGYKVCRYVGAGRPTADAIPVVMNDLKTTVAGAMYVISASMRELC